MIHKIEFNSQVNINILKEEEQARIIYVIK
jgi:hypothetical protein